MSLAGIPMAWNLHCCLKSYKKNLKSQQNFFCKSIPVAVVVVVVDVVVVVLIVGPELVDEDVNWQIGYVLSFTCSWSSHCQSKIPFMNACEDPCFASLNTLEQLAALL